MPLLANITFDTLRPSVSNSSTHAASPYLSGVDGHIMPTSASNRNLPVAAQESDYTLTVDTGTDVREGDITRNILQKDTGVAWPMVGLGTNANETFTVVFAHESTPGHILQHRKVYITRIRGGGPVY